MTKQFAYIEDGPDGRRDGLDCRGHRGRVGDVWNVCHGTHKFLKIDEE